MSNFYSCLGDSDDEESPKLSKPTAGSTGKTEDKKKSAPAKAAPGGKSESNNARTMKESVPIFIILHHINSYSFINLFLFG